MGKLDNVIESTWGATDENVKNNNVYPLWDDPNNEIHKMQWEMFNKVIDKCNIFGSGVVEGFENLPIWKESIIEKLEDENIREEVSKELLVLKSMLSDPYWWASGKVMPTGEKLYDRNMIEKGIDQITSLAKICGDEEFSNSVESLGDKIKESLT